MAKKSAEAKEQAPKEDAEYQQPDTKKPEPQTKWRLGRYFWGLLFVLIGTLALLANFNVVDIYLGNLWYLWPLAVIALGVSLLRFRGIWWKIVSILFLLFSLGLIAWVVVDESSVDRFDRAGDSAKQVQEIAYDSAVALFDLTIKANTTSLHVDSFGGDSAFATAKLSGTSMQLKTNSTRANATLQANISTEADGLLWFHGLNKNNLDVSLHRSVPTKLTIDSGASRVSADLSQVRLENLDIRAGASEINATLGAVSDISNITIDAGASSVTLRIPKNSGVKIVLDGGLAKSDFDDSIQSTGENTYESADFQNAANKISIAAKIGAGSFTIERY